MTELNQVYKCNICGNIVEMVHAGPGELFCCGQPMVLMKENTVDASLEKHVPVIVGNMVKVGSVPHPMEEKHWIELIQVFVDDKLVVEKRLYPGDKPELEIPSEYIGKKIKAREYCNLHYLWRS